MHGGKLGVFAVEDVEASCAGLRAEGVARLNLWRHLACARAVKVNLRVLSGTHGGITFGIQPNFMQRNPERGGVQPSRRFGLAV